LARRAERQGDAVGYDFLANGEREGESWTYGELDARARAFAYALDRRGGRGERALLLFPPGLEFVAALFGCLYAGVVAVPAYPPRAGRDDARLEAIARDCGAKFVLAPSRPAPTGSRPPAAPGLSAGNGSPAPPWLSADSGLPAAPESAAAGGLLASLEWVCAEELSGGQSGPVEAGPGEVAILQYTSGSTGAPKGVRLTHANLAANLDAIAQRFEHGPESRGVIWLPPYHDMGLIGGVLQPIYVGFPVTLMSPLAFLQKPLRWLSAIARTRATTSGGPNFAYERCVSAIPAEQRAGLELSSWRVAFTGAEPVRAETLDRFAEAFAPCGFRREAFYPCYGLAEATLLVAGGVASAPPRVRVFGAAALEAGRAIEDANGRGTRALVGNGGAAAGTRVAIVDPETGLACAAGAVGEVWVAGPGVADGYWGQPARTAATFGARLEGSSEAFLRTGDLGFEHEGELYVTGRRDDLIIVRGRNLHPHDVEQAAERAHPLLRFGGGAAFAFEGGAGVWLVHEVERRATGSVGEIIDAVRRTVATACDLALEAVVLIKAGSLPRTTSGKVQRSACRRALREGRLEVVWREGGARATDQGEPWRLDAASLRTLQRPARRAAVLASLRAWVQRRLGRALSGPDEGEPLVALGLDSLGAAELAGAVGEECGVEFDARSWLEGATLGSVADAVADALAAGSLGGEAAAGPARGGDEASDGNEASGGDAAGGGNEASGGDAAKSDDAARFDAEARRGGEAPATPAQSALWFLHQLAPGSGAYVIARALRLVGPLDPALLSACLGQLVERHAALRTTLVERDGTIVQAIGAPPERVLAVEEARGWSPEQVVARLEREARRPFELGREPPWRALLLRRGGDEWALGVVVHHAACDLASLVGLLEELRARYAAARAGAPMSTLAPVVSFANFARYQRVWLEGERAQASLSYWQAELGGGAPALELPTDRPRPPVPALRGGVEFAALEAATAAALGAFAASAGATRYGVTLAAFTALLGRYAGRDEFFVGTPSEGRPGRAFAATVGYFANPVAVRADLRGRPSFGELVARTKRAAAAALAHAELPFATLVGRLGVRRAPGENPVFQAMLAYQGARAAGDAGAALAVGGEGPSFALGDVSAQPLRIDAGGAQFDLTLVAAEGPGSLQLALHYDAELFEPTTARRMLDGFVCLLRSALAEPARPIATLAWLSPQERARELRGWNETEAWFPRASTLPELFEAQVARTPDAVAIAEGKATLTYRSLDGRVDALAGRLRAAGVGPESRVGVLLERSTELVVALLAVLKAGAAYVPIDPSNPREVQAFLAADAGVSALLVRNAEHARRAEASAGGAELVCVDGAGPAGVNGPAARPANVAYVIYTSGSTGRPKGVMVPHEGVVNRLTWMQAAYGLGPADAVLQKTTFAFDVSVWEFFWPLLNGARLVLAAPGGQHDPAHLAELIEREAITTLHFVPSALEVFLDGPYAARCRRLRRVICSGEALSPGLAARFFAALPGVELHNLYGPTEASIDVTSWACVEGDSGRSVPIGRPIANTECYVLDSELEPVPAGVAGELYLGGVGLARGYLGRPGLTAERFVPDPFAKRAGTRLYRTGDRARRRADGALEFLGRLDDQVKIRGFRVELAEVEAALRRQPGVRDAVAVARGEGAERSLVAYVVGAADATDAAGLRARLGEALPGYMVPSVFVPLDRLPLTASGKIDRRALPPPGVGGAGRRGGAAPFEPSPFETLVAAAWREALGVEAVGAHDNFFDLGGHSLQLARVLTRLRVAAPALTMVDLFRHPTVASLAAFLGGAATAPAPAVARPARATSGGPVAIVGLAGRFPGARNVDEFWANLRQGVESITRFTDEEVAAAGVPAELARDPHYVKAGGLLPEVDRFDAALFGLSPREAEITDPQQRVFLECAWEALESAGIDPARAAGGVAVFAGVGVNTYRRTPGPGVANDAEAYQALVGNDKDFLATRVSYKLDLRGPSVTVQTGCSSSLVAVHEACACLLRGECDVALAGGVAARFPERAGYLYQEGSIASPDGHCRAFDANARGTVPGAGAGVVVLKRLDDAIADGDVVRAIVRGSAVNNDGAAKVGFTAPSVEGQARVVAAAYAAAGVGAEGVDYVEAHGTGTPLGDPVELEALSQVYRAAGVPRGGCAIGSVKTNIGHLDAAAGVAGLIKTVLALEHGELPASLHYEALNPEVDAATCPFEVNATLRPWPRRGRPRRAAVSSFGIGGTNAHVLVEEGPPPSPSPLPPAGPPSAQLLLLSANSEGALGRLAGRLADHLETTPETPLADVAHTLRVGRRALRYRRAIVAAKGGRAVEALRDAAAAFSEATPDARVAFLFPGQGSQYVGMGRGLLGERAFREAFERCAAAVPELDLRATIYPEGDEAAAAARLNETVLTQPALFAVEYALARLLMSWGLRPAALVGHSVGEYVAACLANLFSVEDAMRLVAERGRLMQQAAPGAMLAVPLGERELTPLLDDGLALAAVNGEALCVAAGPADRIAALARALASRDVATRALETTRAFHSPMMEPAIGPFLEAARRVTYRALELPVASNVSGAWLTDGQACNPSYWARHLRETVRFHDNVGALLAADVRVFVEVGPGRALGRALRHALREGRAAFSALPRPLEGASDGDACRRALGAAWAAGASVDWEAFGVGEPRRRVVLPSYPFERERFWRSETPTPAPAPGTDEEPKPIAEWLYAPSFRRAAVWRGGSPLPRGDWLVIADEGEIGEALARELEGRGDGVALVRPGGAFRALGGRRFEARLASADDARQLLGELEGAGGLPARVVHLGGLTPLRAAPRDEVFESSLRGGFLSVVALARALGARGAEARWWVVGAGAFAVEGSDELRPASALVLGPCRVIPQEYEGMQVRYIDASPGAEADRLVRALLAELTGASEEPVVALRGRARWLPCYEQLGGLQPSAPSLREGGVYVVVGGLGGVGRAVATHFARRVRARLMLVGRRPLPPRRGGAEGASADAGLFETLEALGAEVCYVSADATRVDELRAAIDATAEAFGRLDGVVLAAGSAGRRAFASLAAFDAEAAAAELRARAGAAQALADATAGRRLDFVAIVSSNAALLGGVGLATYAGAHAFLDAFATDQAQREGAPWTSASWDTWSHGGEGQGAALPRSLGRHAITPEQGGAALERLLSTGLPHVVVSKAAFEPRTRLAPPEAGAPADAPPGPGPRRAGATPYAAPGDDLERTIARVWQELLGVEAVGVDDNFFELGGDSLVGVRVVERLRRELNVTIDEVSLFEGPTVRALARVLGGVAERPGEGAYEAGVKRGERRRRRAR
jgi:amino acid adenylation domain-containing protein